MPVILSHSACRCQGKPVRFQKQVAEQVRPADIFQKCVLQARLGVPPFEARRTSTTKDRSTPGSRWLDATRAREQSLKELNSARKRTLPAHRINQGDRTRNVGHANLLPENVKRWRSNDLTAHFGGFFSPCYDGFRNAGCRLSLN